MRDFVPNEIVFDMLSRLPVKSLGRFKCVCKTWRSLISDPMMQEKLASRGPKVLLSSPSSLRSWDCSKASLSDKDALINLDFPLRKPEEDIEVIGSCNGLVCIYLKKEKARDFFLWNPTTGDYKKLPGFSFRFIFLHGFGYDLSTKDYKVLCGDFGSSGKMYEILATKTGSWRKIPDPGICWKAAEGSFTNGNLHWLAEGGHSGGGCYEIWAFDLAQEIFHKVPTPRVDGFLSFPNFEGLSVLDGCLCLINSGRSYDTVELWVMKEYGLQSTWEKLFTIKEIALCYFRSWKPVCCTRSGEVILMDKRTRVYITEFLRCNFKEGAIKVRTTYTDDDDDTSATAYTESLVSPNVFV